MFLIFKRLVKQMKRFITTISLQGRDLIKTDYIPADNPDLTCPEKISFPILLAVNNNVDEGEEIIVSPIIINAVASNNNFEIFLDELNEIASRKKFTYSLLPIYKDLGDTIDDMIKLFSKLIDTISDYEDIYACITYGTKPISVLTIMALNYAYKIKENVQIKNIVYGLHDWEKRQSFAYDVTPLFFIDSAINSLAKLNLKHPEYALRAMLGLETECEETTLQE